MAATCPPRMRRFAEELLRNPNGSRAARRVGISEKNARKWACIARQDERFLAYYAERLAEAEREAQFETHRILEELAIVAHSNIEHYRIDFENERVTLADGAPEHAMRALASVKFRRTTHRDRDGGSETTVTAEMRLWDKNTALTNAMKHKALLAERIEHSGPDGGAIPHTVTVHFVTPTDG